MQRSRGASYPGLMGEENAMILQSDAQFRLNVRAGSGTSRLRIGMVMLGSVVALLALMNLMAGAA